MPKKARSKNLARRRKCSGSKEGGEPAKKKKKEPGVLRPPQETNPTIHEQPPLEEPSDLATTAVQDDGAPVNELEFEDVVLGDIPPKGLLDNPNIRCKQIESKRICIEYIFINVHHAPPREKWSGKNGVSAQIKKALAIPEGTCIKKELEDIMSCLEKGIEYDPSVRPGRGRQAVVKRGSVVEQTIANLVETGSSIEEATNLLNEELKEKHATNDCDSPLLLYSVSSVYTCIKSLKPKVSKIKLRSQGRVDENSPWAKARLGWATQLLIKLGLLEEDPTKDYYTKSKLESLEISQIVFWDETHTKCVIGAGAGRDFVFVFPRDSNGNLNPDGGTYTDTKFNRLKVKYEKEVRLCLGCAAVQINGQDEYVGKRCVPFDYSGKTILSISDYKSKCQAEIQRVRALKGEVPPWYLKTRVKDKCYRNDTVRIGLKRVGKVLQEQFQMINIFTIQDLIETEGSFADRLNPCPPGCKWREDQLQSWYKQAKENLVEGDGKEVVDHRKAENPYESRYGQGWEEELRKVLHRNGSVSVAHLVDHIVHESAQTMKGTKHDNDWRFYHDALTLMTSADLIDYMKAKGIYHRWILPEQGLFEDDTALRNYRGRPPGDSPELMPWDNNLNQDAHVSVERHVGITSVYEKGDPRKFSKSTPNEGARAYKRVLHPTEGVAPTPKRIVQDCMLWLQALEEIRKSKGTLNDFAKRRGTRGEFSAEERAEMIRTGSRQRGGRREKGSGFRKCLVLHHDAKPAAKIKIEEASKTCEQQRLPVVDSETQVPIQHN